MKTKTSAISKLCPTRQAGIATHVHFNASPGPKTRSNPSHSGPAYLQARFSQVIGEEGLFLSSLGEGLVVGLGKGLDITLLAVLFVITLSSVKILQHTAREVH